MYRETVTFKLYPNKQDFWSKRSAAQVIFQVQVAKMINNSDTKLTPAKNVDDVIILMRNIDSNDSKSQ